MEANQNDNGEPADKGRRQVLGILLGFTVFSSLVGVFMPILGYLIPPRRDDGGGGGRVKVGTTEDIPGGQGKVVSMGNKPVIVVNTDQGYKAFSAICPHLGCINVWDDARQVILCPCHDGQFNPISGAVVSGPPPSPLPPVNVIVDGDDIYLGEA